MPEAIFIQGNSLEVLKGMDDNSINCCVTSPPYWGLRDYQTGQWEGGNPDCDHKKMLLISTKSTLQGYPGENIKLRTNSMPYATICKKCGAKRIDKQLGLEETPEEYVAKLVSIFREVWRTLKKDGTCWLNLGDSYAGGKQGRDDGGESGGSFHGQPKHEETKPVQRKPPKGLKPKDLVGIPWKVAFALRDDGWYLRQDIIWAKGNCMPESVKDRCTKSHEYIFLLSKSRKYYFDYVAIQEDIKDSTKQRYKTGWNGNTERGYTTGKQNNLDKYMDPEKTKHEKRNKRSVWTVNVNSYKEAHFATFPAKLIEPCILAGCPVGGVVLDPFSGSGTTIYVANKYGRNGVGIELNPDYIKLSEKRCQQQFFELGG